MRSLMFSVVAFSSLLSAQSWSSWKTDQVFPGVEVRARCTGYNEFAHKTLWDIQLRNDYKKDIDLAWAAAPEAMHGSQAQADHAFAVKPGEVIGAHATAPQDCSSDLMVKIDDVRMAGAANVPSSGKSASVSSNLPNFAGHWQSKDPEPLRKELGIQFSGHDKTVTSTWTSPSFSFQVTTRIPDNLLGSVSVGDSSH